jgi:hypothetical protein
MRSFALLLGTLELQHLVRRGDDKVVASAVVNLSFTNDVVVYDILLMVYSL